ncbi:Spo0E family sporulation regulatory protein-aspartic acid phosphatase [Pontibacillus yanchengensis]|uniref:Spo0E family sporulation regulatory protein-aspartic acid phosphatase n=2 Tax=Pontibacillus yanchengensis TaxID=462910 RepID=A0ACC7VC32_9BACI|nr:aspartyl-phosphate phosphatase Spo0E family protein [Pontibacillus yanchengensis]MYL34794.1 Spo0E family sporulation regulatory protein-aspartic acid phosphatase [Pontibacillus yanchengensis]MYL52220.1 Spo0E family sporulation regulatory protein-aspartic acid phosphatase [Pontibacillus yanchengensis]
MIGFSYSCDINDELQVQIQEKRQKMIHSAKEHGLQSDQTINISQELDILINKFLHLRSVRDTEGIPMVEGTLK